MNYRFDQFPTHFKTQILTCHYNYSLSIDATITISKNSPVTGEQLLYFRDTIDYHSGSNRSANLAGLLSSKCRVRSRKNINMHNGRVNVFIHCYNFGFLHTNEVSSQLLQVKMRSSILNKRRSRTIKTIHLPGLSRALLTLIKAFQTLLRIQNKSANFNESRRHSFI